MRYKQRAFLQGYLVHFNATKAAKDAGYSEKTAYSIGQHLLKNVEIKRAIEERMASRDEVVAGLTDISRGDVAKFMDFTTAGYTINLTTMDKNGALIPKPETKLIKKIKQKVTTILAKSENGEDKEFIETEFELYSAHDAYRDLGKVHGIFTDNVDLTSGGKPITWREFIEGMKANADTESGSK